jgi:hypothetical protein
MSQGVTPTRYVLTQGEGIQYPHATLWAITQRMYRAACKRKKARAHYDLLVLLGIPLTLEAYLNLVLMQILPADWADEGSIRDGIQGKLDRIVAKLDLPALNNLNRPFSTIAPLFDLKDRLVHAKPQYLEIHYVRPRDQEPDLLSPWMADEINHDRATRAMQDFPEFLEPFHKPVYEKSLVMSSSVIALPTMALAGATGFVARSSIPLFPGDVIPEGTKRQGVARRELREAGLRWPETKGPSEPEQAADTSSDAGPRTKSSNVDP